MAEWVLGIETSCDETSAAVLRLDERGAEIAGLSILSQDVHRIFGGVVPELASRAHVQAIGSVVDRALADAGIGLGQLDGVAVTAGPGLVGALLVGVMYGKTLAFSLDRQGRVTASRIAKSSGSSALDEATLDLVRRAQPFPAPPPEMGGEVNLSVPIRYNIR